MKREEKKKELDNTLSTTLCVSRILLPPHQEENEDNNPLLVLLPPPRFHNNVSSHMKYDIDKAPSPNSRPSSTKSCSRPHQSSSFTDHRPVLSLNPLQSATSKRKPPSQYLHTHTPPHYDPGSLPVSTWPSMELKSQIREQRAAHSHPSTRNPPCTRTRGTPPASPGRALHTQ